MKADNIVRQQNYKGEKYFEPETLIHYLDNVCEALIANFQTNNKSYFVKDIIEANSFNNLWDESPNNFDNKHSKNEYKGIYAFADVVNGEVDFLYVGISQTIRRRFGKHTTRNRKNEASWAYLMIKHHFLELSIAERQLKIPEYQQKIIYPIKFSFCLINDNMLMHIAEVYCANKLKAQWNTFETH